MDELTNDLVNLILQNYIKTGDDWNFRDDLEYEVYSWNVVHGTVLRIVPVELEEGTREIVSSIELNFIQVIALIGAVKD